MKSLRNENKHVVSGGVAKAPSKKSTKTTPNAVKIGRLVHPLKTYDKAVTGRGQDVAHQDDDESGGNVNEVRSVAELGQKIGGSQVSRDVPLKDVADTTIPSEERYIKTESMRFDLTPWERDSVLRLKAACDEQNVLYKSIFELAKYVLVVKSSVEDTDADADSKRLQAALKRMKTKRIWEAKLGYQDVDKLALLEEVNSAAPDYYVNHFLSDNEGHRIVAHHHAYAPTKWLFASKENLAKFLVTEQWRMELGAADMEEARCGMAMVSITDGKLTLSKAYRYLKMLPKMTDNLEEMHSQRIRRIYSQVPSFLSRLIQPAKRLLPAKIAKRIIIVPTMAELFKYIAEQGPESDSVIDWATERTLVYNETVEKLKLALESEQLASPAQDSLEENKSSEC